MSFQKRPFKLNVSDFTFDNWGILPPTEYVPGAGVDELGQRLPEDWSVEYKGRYGQYFQPSIFYRNCALLANLARVRPEHAAAGKLLFSELQDRLIEHSMEFDGARFVVNSFDFPRKDYTIRAPWYGSIMNAFAMAGLIKVRKVFPDVVSDQVIAELARAFAMLRSNDGGSPWISAVDKEGFLWFEEYPDRDGSGSRVQNGHIFSIFALSMYHDLFRDDGVATLVAGGLTTIKNNALRFRRPGAVPLYCLRDATYPDYAPLRAVKQQAQLYSLTGDRFFRGMAYILAQDLEDAGHPPMPAWVLAPAGG